MLEESKNYIDNLYKEYFNKFEHKDPNKKQWYVIQMVTNVLEAERLKIEREKIELLIEKNFAIAD